MNAPFRYFRILLSDGEDLHVVAKNNSKTSNLPNPIPTWLFISVLMRENLPKNLPKTY